MLLFYRCLFYIFGLFVLTFGASLTIKADVGVGAWDALNVGLSNTFGFTIGTWVILVGIMLIFVNAALLMRKPDFFALMTIFTVGILIDFWLLYVEKDWVFHGYPLRFFLLIVGLAIIAIGVAIYLQSKFAVNPIDNFMVALRERFGFTLLVAKTIGEIVALVLALFVSGPIGIGTLVITIAIGPFIQLFFPHFEKLFQKITLRYS